MKKDKIKGQHEIDVEEKNQEQIYFMDLHQKIVIAGELTVTRVPGGWIYADKYGANYDFKMIFVPFNNEFNSEK